MYCTICKSPIRAEIIEAWGRSGSLRKTARQYGVGYRSLQRHLDLCLASILSEQEQREYEIAFKENAEWIRKRFAFKVRKPRPKSIITKPVAFTWSKRSWTKKT